MKKLLENYIEVDIEKELDIINKKEAKKIEEADLNEKRR